MMNPVQVRAVLYGIIAGGQTMMLGVKDGTMTTADWIRLFVSSVVAAAIAIKALYDTAPDNLPSKQSNAGTAATTDLKSGQMPPPPAPTSSAPVEPVGTPERTAIPPQAGAGDLSKAETKKVEIT
jgi:hypothetical protein